jgi:hypothetical protein
MALLNKIVIIYVRYNEERTQQNQMKHQIYIYFHHLDALNKLILDLHQFAFLFKIKIITIYEENYLVADSGINTLKPSSKISKLKFVSALSSSLILSF